MGAITINLSNAAQHVVDEAVRRGDYSDAAAYVEALVAERHARAREELNHLLEEGLASGVSEQSFAEIVEEANRDCLAGRL